MWLNMCVNCDSQLSSDNWSFVKGNKNQTNSCFASKIMPQLRHTIINHNRMVDGTLQMGIFE